MALTEKEQIQEEIAAILEARPGPERRIDLSPLEHGKSVTLYGSCFGQYRGYALYESGVIGFPVAWGKKEPPPLTVQIILSKRPDGCLQFDVRGKGLPLMAQKRFDQV